MSNSPLATYKKLSPNHSGKRTHAIDTITPHCVVGQLTAEGIAGCFTSPSRQASCNYGIGKDGKIALIVDEGNRSWCSSNAANDQRAVTIECASDKSHPYAMTDAVYKSLVSLCVDICKRNGKSKLLFLGDKARTQAYSPKKDEMLLTVHRWFKNKACPGDWLFNRLGNLAQEVTAQLGGQQQPAQQAPQKSEGTRKVKVKVGDLNIRTEPSMQGKVVGQTGKGTFTITEQKNGWGHLKSGAGWINLNKKYVTFL